MNIYDYVYAVASVNTIKQPPLTNIFSWHTHTLTDCDSETCFIITEVIIMQKSQQQQQQSY